VRAPRRVAALDEHRLAGARGVGERRGAPRAEPRQARPRLARRAAQRLGGARRAGLPVAVEQHHHAAGGVERLRALAHRGPRPPRRRCAPRPAPR
jgi:hypothetical protein